MTSTVTAAGTRRVPWRTTLVGLAVFTVAVFLGRLTQTSPGEIALLWPATGIGFLVVARHLRDRRRLTLVLGVSFVAIVVIGPLTGLDWRTSAVLGVANVVQALVGPLVHARLQPAGFRLRSVRELWFLLAATLTAGATGAVVALPVVLFGDQHLGEFLAHWFVRHVASTLIVAGGWIILTDPLSRFSPVPRRTGELVLGTLLTSVSFLLLFDVGHQYGLSFLVVVPTLWMGLRLRTRTAIVNAFAVNVLQAVLAGVGSGTFAELPLEERLLDVQLLNLLMTSVTIVLALNRDERERLVAASEERSRLLHTVFETTSDGMMVHASDGSLLMDNSAAHGMYPVLPDGVDFDRWPEFVRVLGTDGDPLPASEIPAARALRGERLENVDIVFHNTLDDIHRTYNLAAHPLPEVEGASWSQGAILAFREVTAERAVAAEVASSRDLYAGILAGATEQAIISLDTKGGITVWSEGAERLYGYTAQEMLGKSPQFLHDPAEVHALAHDLGLEPGLGLFTHEVERTGRPDTRQWTMVHKDGRRLQVLLTISLMLDHDGNRIGLIGVASDVTDQIAVQTRLVESELRFRTVFDTAPVGMLLVGMSDSSRGRILQVNTTMSEFTGLDRWELHLLDVHALTTPEDRGQFRDEFDRLLNGAVCEAQLVHRYVHADGGIRWGRLSATRVEADGVEPYLLCLVEDITARREAEEALLHQASHDTLTGLPNRSLLRERLSEALSVGLPEESTVGVLLIDLDGFKAVNDTAGHAAGDALLRVVAGRLSAVSRGDDTVARLGGDEFAVVCPGAGPDSLEPIALRLLSAVREPVVLASGTFHVGASIGFAAATAAGATDDVLDRVLQDADLAMYAAKRDGKNQAYAYDERDRDRFARAERLLPELAEALHRDEFVLFGQPIVDLTTGRTVAVETLIRWDHPVDGIRSPGTFLDVLENSPLMPAVGRRVLEESCRMAAAWAARLGADAPAVHVNVSACQLDDGGFADDIDRVLAATGLPPRLLVVELTETHTARITDRLRTDLDRLRRNGVRVAIDDLGTGYSSLARLTELPVDLLKIDLQFIAGLGIDPSCDAVVRAVLGIGQALQLEVVAEGVETAEQADLLRSYGADTAQGYLYSKPLAEDVLMDVLTGAVVAG